MASRAFASRAMKSQTSFTRNGTVQPKACSALKGRLGSAIPGASATSVPASSFSFVVSVAEVTLPQQYPTHEEEVSEP
jgi:hypothetical protein